MRQDFESESVKYHRSWTGQLCTRSFRCKSYRKLPTGHPSLSLRVHPMRCVCRVEIRPPAAAAFHSTEFNACRSNYFYLWSSPEAANSTVRVIPVCHVPLSLSYVDAMYSVVQYWKWFVPTLSFIQCWSHVTLQCT